MRFPACASSAACRRREGADPLPCFAAFLIRPAWQGDCAGFCEREGIIMAAKRLHVYRKKRKAARWLWLLLPFAILAGIGLLWRYDAASGSRPRTVEILLETAAGEKLAAAPVSALIDTASLPISEWGGQASATGADGRCRFEGILPGSYWLRAADNLYELRIPENAPDAVFFALSAEPDRYTAVLRLQDARGEPIARQKVSLLETELEKSASLSFSAAIQGETDWQGNLVLENIRAGGHLLCLEGAAPVPFVIEPNEKKTVSGLLCIYPEQKGPVSENICVYGPNARPLKREPVTRVLYGLPGGREIALSQEETDENGRLALSLPSPGAYTLRIRNRRLKLEPRGTGQPVEIYL